MSEDKHFMQPVIPVFYCHYDHWSMLMENLLKSKRYWHLIETDYKEPKKGETLSEVWQKEYEDLMLKDLKAKNYLFQAIDRTTLEQILEKHTAKQIWDSMKKKYEGNAKSPLIVHEQKFHRNKVDEQALKVTIDDQNENKGRRRGQRGYTGRGRGRGWQPFNKATIERYKFHKLGHFQYECSTLKNVNYVELNEKEEMLLMSYVDVNHASQEDIWFLDSSCSNHMSSNKVAFHELDEAYRDSIKLDNNTKMSVLEKEM
ncbi:uncharacterized protein LOC120079306 [Benincasa hispida]|uniref:uncharacterized protein LOC120079306 n=1 Tax=Benincasa hispida TaxID=102211 RepID=UPI0019017CCB|nr:uncharacterized protein LOC120079306 [Benincasa hispida]